MPGAGQILMLAALFQGTFSIDWVVELAQKKVSKILQALDYGESQDWIRNDGVGRYTFTRESHRQRLLSPPLPDKWPETCRRAADILIRELPDNADKAMVVADLLLGLDNALDSCRQLVTAGDLFRKRFQTVTALRCYEKALDDLDRLERSEASDELICIASIQYSKLFSANTDAGRILTALKKAIAIADEHHWLARWSLLKMHLAKQMWMGSSFRSALSHFNQGWAVSEQIDDENYRRSAQVFGMYFLFWQGRFKEALTSYERHTPEIEHLPHEDFPLMARITIGCCYAYCGNVTQGIGMLDTIRESCIKKGNLGTAGKALLMMGLSFVETGRIAQGRDHFQTALSQGQKSHDVLVEVSALLGLAHSHYHLAQPKRAISYLERFKELSQHAHMAIRNVPVVIEMCWAMETGQLPSVKGFSLEEEISQALRSQNVYMRGTAYLYRARLRKRKTNKADLVIHDLVKATELLATAGHRLHLAVARLDLAREWFSAGKVKEARNLAGPSAQYLMAENRALMPNDLHHLLRHLRTEKNLIAEMMALSQELVTLRADHDLVGRVLSSASRLSGAERGAIFTPAQASEHFELKASRNLSAEDVADQAFSVAHVVITDTFKTASGRVETFNSTDAHQNGKRAIRACICVPMRLRKKVVGVLYLDNRMFPSTFETDDIPVLDYFAAQAAIAMENARAYTLLQEGYLKQKEEIQHHEQQYLERLNFDEMVGKSPGIRRVFRQIDSVAATSATVLISGETGVGKELVARAIHRSSPRKDGPFIRVNCSAFSMQLIASELFGHEKGAFTGASHTHLGRFELAHGGTLFLDEIGDIPLAIQVRLLRVLQSKEFERVGGQTTLRSDFRLMAATNRDLLAAVHAGTFRQDLFYRLNVFPIEVPPLRARRTDISLMVEYFLKKFANRHDKSVAPVSPTVLAHLINYHWPGNVRELENHVERAVILSRGNRLELPESTLDTAATTVETSYMVSHAENERRHIIAVLKQVGGKIAGPGGAAKLLELHPNTLRYRIKKLTIKQQDWIS